MLNDLLLKMPEIQELLTGSEIFSSITSNLDTLITRNVSGYLFFSYVTQQSDISCSISCEYETYCFTPTLAQQKQPRLLQSQRDYQIGTWRFEHENKIKFKLDQYEVGVTLVQEKTVNVEIKHPELSYDSFQYTLGENGPNFGANYASVKSISPEMALLELSD